MSRILAFFVLALMGSASFGQMNGTSVSTSQYFPLVDAARYDYMHTGGPWATSTVTVHSGQSWAGFSGLTAMHTAYVCNAGVACAPYATDFYRMDPDGVRYFGGAGSDAAGAQFSMAMYTDPEWILKNPVTPGTPLGPRGGSHHGSEAWYAGVAGTSQMMNGQSHMSSYQAVGFETVTIPAGTFANVVHVREQRGSGPVRDVWYAPGVGMVKVTDGSGTAMLTGYTIPGPIAQPGGGSAPLAFTPATGLWWNPGESGTGYSIEVQRGIMVVTMYSYSPEGDPVWYLIVGSLANAGNGVAATGTLDRYHGGQCASCAYRMPEEDGNDGRATFTFTSPTSATVELPGGRMTRIEPEAW